MRAEDFKAAKKDARRRVEAAIARMSSIERFGRSALAQKRLIEMPPFVAGRAVLLYHSMPAEIETCDLILHALSEGKRVGLPRTCPTTRTMDAILVRDVAADLCRGPYGALEPRAGLPAIPVREIDLVVVPGRAFDPHGRRLGRGAGYYDRYLASPGFHGVSVALAFDCQVLEEIPSLPHDVPVDFIVTESRTIVREK